MSSKRPNPLMSPIYHEIQGLEPKQRRKMLQIAFWALLVYLELTWFGLGSLHLLVPAAVIAVAALAARRTFFGRRPSLLVLHGALLAAMVRSAIETGSWITVADFAVLGAIVVLELTHRRASLLIALALEHGLALFLNPWSEIRFMNDPQLPQVGAAALFRIFAIIMLMALYTRVFAAPRLVPTPEPDPEPPAKPSRPLTVAEWEARNPSK